MAGDLHHWKEVEATCRRAGARPHPDQCPKIKIKGVLWAVPPRSPSLRPVFDPSGAAVLECRSGEPWPQAATWASSRPRGHDHVCPACRRPIGQQIEIDLRDAQALSWLSEGIALMGRMLDEQYTLDAAAKGDLLAFEAGMFPEYLMPLLRWCVGLEPYGQFDDIDWTALAASDQDALAAELSSPAPVRRGGVIARILRGLVYGR
ncbi:MAG: hypothetical protein ABFD92_16855 [Planctomycetaceae bacterium]|nr:hypothetical protein [Planctomycetaceae bacterium]